MCDGDRSEHDSMVAFAVVVCLSPVGLIGWYQGYEVGQESHQSDSAEAYKNYSYKEISNHCVFSVGSAAQTECIAQAVKGAREQQRAEEDLDAQQEMSEWAKWMLISTIVMAAITLFGVMFVWQTLTATREMASDQKGLISQGDKTVEAAMKSADAAMLQVKASMKPYVSLKASGPFAFQMERFNDDLPQPNGEYRLIFQCKIIAENIGSVPFEILEFFVRLAGGKDFPDWNYIQDRGDFGHDPELMLLAVRVGDSVCLTSHGHGGRYVTGQRVPQGQMDGFRMNPPPFVGWIKYSDPVGNLYRQRFAFVARPSWGETFSRWGGKQYNFEEEVEK